jgi:adenosylcobyric acid synthase
MSENQRVKMKGTGPLQLMFLGTGSDVGKSIIAAGFCRILLRKGYRVAPFKAQNMALNSFVTMDGKEMGRAQVFQAWASGIPPDSDMNPVLLKPAGENHTQVILQGKVLKSAAAMEYYSMKDHIFSKVVESYSRLKDKYNAIVLEGAGSTTEINLKKNDIVNINLALHLNSPAIIIADIDRGGVFASLIGTMKLLTRKEKRLVLGSIINKFRGDKNLFASGKDILEESTRRPVFGVVPYFQDVHLPEEDSVALQRGKKGSMKENSSVKIAVVHLPYISNYTDFDPFEIEEGVSIWYARDPEEIEESAVVILPGTKNTIEDLLWLRKRGFEIVLKEHLRKGKTIIGICGGYQMLGATIEDPFEVESSRGKVRGLGLLPVKTSLEKEKKLTRVTATSRIGNMQNVSVQGYEIHMGMTKKRPEMKPAFIIGQDKHPCGVHEDGAVSENGRVWGTYLHGLFENDAFRSRFLSVHGRITPRTVSYHSYLEKQFDRLADIIEANVDVQGILDRAKKFC